MRGREKTKQNKKKTKTKNQKKQKKGAKARNREGGGEGNKTNKKEYYLNNHDMNVSECEWGWVGGWVHV